jgi:hypothetical protein
MESHLTITATFRQQVDMFDRHLVGSGNYWEVRQPGAPLTRLELRLQIGNGDSSLVEVCDGRYLWSHRTLLEKETLSRIDAVRATRALERATAMPDRNTMMLPALGGLSKLLRSLNVYFQFAPAVRGHIGQSSVDVWRLEGSWRPEQLVRMLPAQSNAIARGKPVDLGQLPRHVPDHVVVYLRHDCLFPYLIDYQRAVPKKEQTDGGPKNRALMTLELSDVNFDVAIEPTRFFYNPGKVETIDYTDSFILSLGIKE